MPGRSAAQATTTQLGAPVGGPASGTGAGSIGGAVLALVLVVGLILLLGWLAKRMPGIGGASNPALKVVGSLSLSPRERVVVVAVGDTQLVLGTGAGGTRVLHQLDTPLPLPQHKAPPAFAQVLAQHFGKTS
ncbi:flagellar biosynthetic protein FliO [Pseudoxanthomonas winnipegensis]|uniref:flagellar biosynthetic protein FliO n=1 Tax=Pseudoxanthomonas winnipegensis TaxID=2480810 RepID=UPI003F85D988